jgi:homopolymeric O-antigen transport system permease protein
MASLGPTRLAIRQAPLSPILELDQLAISVITVGLVGSGLWNQNLGEYLPFLVSGMLVWLLVSTIISESAAYR